MKKVKTFNPSDMTIILSGLLYKIPEYEFTFDNTLNRRLKNINWDNIEKILHKTINECMIKPHFDDSLKWRGDPTIDLGYGATLRLLFDDDGLYVELKDGYLDTDRLLGGSCVTPHELDWDIDRIVKAIMKDLKKGPDFYKKEMSLDDYGKRINEQNDNRDTE